MRFCLVFMLRLRTTNLLQNISLLVLVLLSSVSWLRSTAAQTPNLRLVELVPVDVDPKQPGRRNFGSLMLLSAFRLESKDKRFGGLSGLSVGKDGKLYAVSDNGYWISAKMVTDPN